MPRRSVSLADAKWPLSMEGAPDRGNLRWSRGEGGSDLDGSRPGGPTRRRERTVHPKPERERDRDVRGRPQRPRRWRTSPARSHASNRGYCGTPKRRSGVRVHPLPRPRGGSQNPSFHTRRKPRGCTGSQRVRVLVVESLGSRHRTNASKGCLSGAASKGDASREVPSPKESDTWLSSPDDQGRPREGEGGALVSRDYPIQVVREEIGLVGRETFEGRDLIRSNHGVRRLGPHAHRP